MNSQSVFLIAAAALVVGCATSPSVAVRNEFGCDMKYRPRLFARFDGNFVNVPDGMTQDADGNLYLDVCNVIDSTYPGGVLKRCAKSGKWSWFCPGLISPKTNRGVPMGCEMGPDGNFYYCDNQYFNSKDYASRVCKVVIDPITKKPLRIEPVVLNIKLANAIRFFGGDMFITDTYFDLPLEKGRGRGGVYRIPMKDFANGPVSLLPKERYREDKYFVGASLTDPLPGRGGDNSGCDGLCIDRDGNLFTGTFGSGRFYTIPRNADGSYGKIELLYENPKLFPCCDGICYDPVKHCVYMTDSALNAVHKWDIATKSFCTLWRNGDTDGADGLLDQPCEPIIWKDPATGKRQLIVVHFDMAFPGLTNKTNDSVHALSAMDID